MFSKPFRVKSNSQLKGTERKKLKQEILRNFPNISEDDLQLVITPKDVLSSIKLITNSDQHVLVYLVQKVPIFFEIEKIFYPTVCLLWHFPTLLHTFTTWPQVIPKLQRGADLMLPGIVLKDGYHIKAFGNLQKGDMVAVNEVSNCAPVAVGKAALSSEDMFMSGKHGKAVEILHYYGDELWCYAGRPIVPNLGPVDIQENKTDPESNLPSSAENSSNNLDIAGAVLSNDEVKETSQDDLCVKMENVEVDEVNSSDKTDCVSKSEMDELLRYCFLKALKQSSDKKVTYPILASKFYKVHVLPACPVGKNLDIKKSNFKKLSTFLKQMEESDVVKVREQTKGVESIISVNTDSDLLKEFKIEENTEDAQKNDSTVASHSPSIIEQFVVTNAVVPVLEKFGFRKGYKLTANQVRRCVTAYVTEQNLQLKDDKRFITLDPVLQKILQAKETSETVQWEELFRKFLGRMTQSYEMTLSEQKSVVGKGKLEPIDIQVGRRTGNKKVTLVNNLELYGIDLNEFAYDCQHGVAASTSISSVPGKKSMQFMVQGNQVHFVGNLLMSKYSIPKRFIRGLEFSVKPRK